MTQMEEEREVYASLARINAQLLAGNNLDARAEYDTLVSQYGEERLLGNAQEDSFDSDINILFTAAKEQIEAVEPQYGSTETEE